MSELPALFKYIEKYEFHQHEIDKYLNDVHTVYQTHNCITYLFIHSSYHNSDDTIMMLRKLIEMGADVHHVSDQGNCLTIALNYTYSLSHHLVEELCKYGLDIQADLIGVEYNIYEQLDFPSILRDFPQITIKLKVNLNNLIGVKEAGYSLKQLFNAGHRFHIPTLSDKMFYDLLNYNNAHDYIANLLENGYVVKDVNEFYNKFDAISLKSNNNNMDVFKLIMKLGPDLSKCRTTLFWQILDYGMDQTIKIMLEYGFRSPGMIYRAMDINNLIYDLVYQYEKPDPESPYFKSMIEKLVVKNKRHSLKHILTTVQMSQKTIDSLHEYVINNINMWDSINFQHSIEMMSNILKIILVYPPLINETTENLYKNNTRSDMYRQCGYLPMDVEEQNQMTNHYFMMACANGKLDIVKKAFRTRK